MMASTVAVLSNRKGYHKEKQALKEESLKFKTLCQTLSKVFFTFNATAKTKTKNKQGTKHQKEVEEYHQLNDDYGNRIGGLR